MGKINHYLILIWVLSVGIPKVSFDYITNSTINVSSRYPLQSQGATEVWIPTTVPEQEPHLLLVLMMGCDG